jgi:A/G-specific adenine glycosylase
VEQLRRDLLSWWSVHGRHDIPWKLNAEGSLPAEGEPLSAFRIWIAEALLQQTLLRRQVQQLKHQQSELQATIADP